MNLKMRFVQSQQQKLVLDQAQKLGLRQLLLLEQQLKHPDYPNMTKGLEGLCEANRILNERESSGLLIGGLAEAVWNKRRTPEELYAHKDVDVMVLDEQFYTKKNFEGGIDWWLPVEEKIDVRGDYARVDGWKMTLWINGNNVVLSFGIRKNHPLPPGLYIPDHEWVVDMRLKEANAHVDYERAQGKYDFNVDEAFKSKIRQRVKTRLPVFIIQEFKGRVLSPDYEDDFEKHNAVELESFDFEQVRAIHNNVYGYEKADKNDKSSSATSTV